MHPMLLMFLSRFSDMCVLFCMYVYSGKRCVMYGCSGPCDYLVKIRYVAILGTPVPLDALDTALKQNLFNRCRLVGKSFFPPDDDKELGNGLMCWKGFHQSLFPTQMGLSLIIGLLFLFIILLSL